MSVAGLSGVFTTISHLNNNLRATRELPEDNTFILAAFDYYNTDDVAEKIKNTGDNLQLGRIYSGGVVSNGLYCNLAAYNDALITRYIPKLAKGKWLSEFKNVQYIPAVVTADTGYKVDETVSLSISNGVKEQEFNVVIVGILPVPTQILYPTGGAMLGHLSSDMLIANETAIIVPFEALDLQLSPMSNLFIFSQQNISELRENLGKYGEISSMKEIKDLFISNIQSELHMSGFEFLLFLSVALAGILSNNIIQSIYNQKTFSVYFICGMNWKRASVIEFARTFTIALISMIIVFIAGMANIWNQLGIETGDYPFFYGITALYLFILFLATSCGFLIKLMHTDLSQTIKNLQEE
jgi:hypothetical protein